MIDERPAGLERRRTPDDKAVRRRRTHRSRDPRLYLRALGPGDGEAAARLLAGALGRDAPGEASLAAELMSPHRYYVGAFHDQAHLVGVAGMVRSAQPDVMTVAVARPARCRGVGRALMAALMSAAAESGASELWLEVGELNESARRLYESCGFVARGRRDRYYADGAAAVTMSADLATIGSRGE